MLLPKNLPEADSAAQAHSSAVKQMIQNEIIKADGWISFEKYMELVLYSPGLGYYSSGATKLGVAGDFTTAPEMSALFGQTLARQARQVMQCVEQKHVLEFGAGTGKLALDILLEMEKLGCLPKKYFFLDVSADLRQRQKKLFEQKAPHLIAILEWLDQLPEQFNGLILANEVLDAMPNHLVAWYKHQIFKRGVIHENGNFKWHDTEIKDGQLFDLANNIFLQSDINDVAAHVPYVSEISLANRHFIRSLAQLLQSGVILLIDYGFGQNEYYHSQRNRGTLMCHYRHHAHVDPFYLPGLQDITCHVNFSAISDEANKSNLELFGYVTQANFLLNCGITDILSEIPTEQVDAYLPLANQLQRLVSPAELGELFKVIAIAKNIDEPLIGFANGDKSHHL